MLETIGLSWAKENTEKNKTIRQEKNILIIIKICSPEKFITFLTAQLVLIYVKGKALIFIKFKSSSRVWKVFAIKLSE